MSFLSIIFSFCVNSCHFMSILAFWATLLKYNCEPSRTHCFQVFIFNFTRHFLIFHYELTFFTIWNRFVVVLIVFKYFIRFKTFSLLSGHRKVFAFLNSIPFIENAKFTNIYCGTTWLGGHSTTTWTNFNPILTPSPPRVDKHGHFTYSHILRRPQNFAKSSPYFWLALHRTKVRWRFRKILWPSQNIWTLLK